MPAPAAHVLLPHAAPASPNLQLVLYGIRRMAAGGIGDAHAASAFLYAFNLHYRRPLVLVRTLMAEVSRIAASRLAIAPCCCPRATASEWALLHGLGAVLADPATAHACFAKTLGVPDCVDVLRTAEAVAVCFGDLGKPLQL